ncbi:hypothetical protein SEUBUCD646_0P03830 [Saccharomyces eubayanus]|uniref:Required for respiratory growth protein 8, mitochondrial n=2 Tax=Saccharomyces TaxID=4930 RepID=A0A6C1EHL2_SACPS|nr:RRG8-like protein [Saccharomyces eubayanus]KOG96405.1 RRG8-like protein [Saccharomyces eubayanus]QID88525.1 Rrg8p [Saccharomyces pastorianus]CAI1780674.1 hypothetical protein SEUBUCD650_0P03840 [Saccharomyces eubayanus]CAI1817288.1 hypothetical protein SEUBUCD646_0P03830 [Saccharomyces eubayanus]
MGLAESLYQKLLINVPKKGVKVGCNRHIKHVSPIVTNFEKWSDKRKKLYFKDEKEMMEKNNLGNFDLENNVYGRLLASPMRAEKISKLKSCRELLIPLKVIPMVGNDQHAENSMLKLAPILDYSKPYKSSYILNSASIVRDNLAAATSWFPLSILQGSASRKLVVNTATFLSEYDVQLRELIISRLSEIKSVGPSSKDSVLLIYNETSTIPIEVQRVKGADGLEFTQSIFNLGCLQTFASEPMINKDVIKEGIYLDANNDKDLIKHLYRFVLFSLG